MAKVAGDPPMDVGSEGDEEGREFRARSYQVELFRSALEKNTIVCLKTGAGKTFIAVMLIKELQHEIAKSFSEGKRSFFMVPKVPLVEQQAKVIEAHTCLTVGRYYGEMGVDFWDTVKWGAELEKHHVIVMTAQILVNLLGAGIMSMNKINLLIFDECHAATGNHPYCAIMSRYQDFEEGPRILGLTAAIVNGKCPPSRVDLQMVKLEKALHCRIQTSRDLLSVARFSTKPREVVVACTNRGALMTIEESVLAILNEALSEMKPFLESVKEENSFYASRNYASYQQMFLLDGFFEDELNVCNETMKTLPSPHILLKNVQSTVFTLGLWCAGFLVRTFQQEIPHWRQSADEQLKVNYVRIYDILHRAFGQVDTKIRSFLSAVSEDRAIIEFTTPKLRRLVELLSNLNPNFGSYRTSFLESFRCIIFVECRITASVLSEYLNKVTNVQSDKLRFLKPCYVVGHGCKMPFFRNSSMNVDKQNEILESFRMGVKNLMVATTVVEEGLDIPRCNVVVRFDPPMNFCSYVQSMGRARAESALYVLLVEDQNRKSLENDLATYKVIEEILQTRSHGRRVATAEETAEFYNLRKLVPPFYPKEKDGACVTMLNSLMILNMYTSRMKYDRYTVVKPDFKYEINKVGRVQCTIMMPTGPLLLRPVTGEPMGTEKEAKQAAGLSACIVLHQFGELDDRLLPCRSYTERYLAELGVVEIEEVVAGAPIPGTKRRRLIYDRTVADDLKNCFPEAEKPVYLYSIRVIDDDDHSKSCFGILSSKPISKMSPFTIFTKVKFTIVVKAVYFPFVLSKQQLSNVKTFHEVLFGDILRLVSTSMVFKPCEAELSFLIVPIVNLSGATYRIDWTSVTRYVNFKAGCCNVANLKERCVPRVGSVVRPSYGNESIRSKRFVVLDVQRDLTPLSEFDREKYGTFANYYQTKYGEVVTDVNQPLLCVDFAPNSISFLTPAKTTGSPRKVKKMNLIPELCEELPLYRDQYQHAFFLPSIIHRVNGMLTSMQLADQIVKEAKIVDELLTEGDDQMKKLEDFYKNCKLDDATIRGDLSNCNGGDIRQLDAPTLYALVYQSLTSRSAANWDDLERLELIGDSYLKYIVSVFLYCEFPHVNEGNLSILRTGLVRNATLCHFSKLKKIPEAMNTSLFQPRINWLPPGYVIPEELAEELTVSHIPAHLWPFATMGDIQRRRLYGDLYVWIEELTDRYNKTDPGIKEAAQVAILKPFVALSDTGAKEQTLNITYNHFTQQLVGDKNVADSAEALIGVVLLSCGQDAALRLLKWLGFRLERRNEFKEDVVVVEGVASFPWTRPKTALVKPVSRELHDMIYCRLDVLEKKLGYKFKDMSFLRQAVVHSSYTTHPATDNYQRLEFLGDAILDFLITMNLYKKYPTMSPGDMTDLRSSLVDNATFAFLSVKCEMHKHLCYNSLLLPQAIDNYLQHHSKLSHPKEAIYMYGEDEVLDLSDVEVPKALGDLFESIAGAVYVDSGFSLEAVWNVFQPILKDLMDDYSKCLPINPIRRLVEHIPSSRFNRATRADVMKNFTVEVFCNDKRFVGCGRTRVVAKQAAAKCALRALKLVADRKLNLD